MGGTGQPQEQIIQPEMSDREQEAYNKQLIRHCKTLFQAAKVGQPTDRLKKFEDYYLGKFDDKDNLFNNYNIFQKL